MDLARVLREFRQQTGMKQEDLAARLTVSQASVSLWEKGNVRPLARTEARIRKFITEYRIPEDANPAVSQMVRFIENAHHPMLLLRVSLDNIHFAAASKRYPVRYAEGGKVPEAFKEAHLPDLWRKENFIGSTFEFAAEEMDELHLVHFNVMRLADETFLIGEHKGMRSLRTEKFGDYVRYAPMYFNGTAAELAPMTTFPYRPSQDAQLCRA